MIGIGAGRSSKSSQMKASSSYSHLPASVSSSVGAPSGEPAKAFAFRSSVRSAARRKVMVMFVLWEEIRAGVGGRRSDGGELPELHDEAAGFGDNRQDPVA